MNHKEAVTQGEQWKMQLLTRQISPDEATDMLYDKLFEMHDAHLIQMLLPMAELRAEQLEKGMHSPDTATRVEAARMQTRYGNFAESRTPGEAEKELGAEVSPLAKAIAGDWLQKVTENALIGEMEKELQRTVDTYKAEKEQGLLRLNHSTAMAR